MIDESLSVYIRSYCVSPGIRGDPQLTVLTDKNCQSFTGKGSIESFLRAADKGAPFRALQIRKETPTGGVYYIWERIDDDEA